MSVGEKRCTKCREKKPITEFGKHEDSSDGHQAYCKKCRNNLNALRRKLDLKARLKHHIASRVEKTTIGPLPEGYTKDLEKYLGYRMWKLRKALDKEIREREGISLRDAFARDYHVDHIKPLTSFGALRLGSPAFRACWAIDNLRAIPSEVNLQKGSRVA
jgi:hypothetical protein